MPDGGLKVIHGGLDAALHAQLGDVLIATLNLEAIPREASAEALSEKEHPGVAPACVIGSVMPATNTAPVRAGPEFAAMFNVTPWEPLPDDAEPNVIQAGLEAALHAHFADDAIRKTLSDEAPPEADAAVVLSRKEHPAGEGAAACCAICSVIPATATAPVRAAPEFAAMFNVTACDPLPDAEPSVIQDGFDAAVHAQPGDDAFTRMVIDEAAEGAATVSGFNE